MEGERSSKGRGRTVCPTNQEPRIHQRRGITQSTLLPCRGRKHAQEGNTKHHIHPHEKVEGETIRPPKDIGKQTKGMDDTNDRQRNGSTSHNHGNIREKRVGGFTKGVNEDQRTRPPPWTVFDTCMDPLMANTTHDHPRSSNLPHHPRYHAPARTVRSKCSCKSLRCGDPSDREVAPLPEWWPPPLPCRLLYL